MKKKAARAKKAPVDWARIVQQFCPVPGGWLAEYTFHPERNWRYDVACPDLQIAIEIEGGVWIRGRHSRGKGMIDDMEKYNAAVVLGWRLLRYTPHQMEHGAFIEDVRTMIASRGGQ